MRKPLLLDLFCGQGGAAWGYHLAGFEVIGVDSLPQPRYPFRFIQMDAIEFLENNWKRFQAIHASPPCQLFSRVTPPRLRKNHLDYITPIQPILKATGLPYVIENVPDARHLLNNPLMLCGSMFGLKVFKHRYFEMNYPIYFTPPCQHDFEPVVVSTSKRKDGRRLDPLVDEIREAVDMSWMSKKGLRQAIPYKMTEFIGRELLRAIV